MKEVGRFAGATGSTEGHCGIVVSVQQTHGLQVYFLLLDAGVNILHGRIRNTYSAARHSITQDGEKPPSECLQLLS